MSFSFSFAGDDIEEDTTTAVPSTTTTAAASQPSVTSSSSAFPVQGKPQLHPTYHDLGQMLSSLPSKIAYSLLDVDLDGNGTIQIPRRELWDVRVQLMAEEDTSSHGEELEAGLGAHDVKTGIYEGGFKSWESSVDLVKVLAAENLAASLAQGPCRIIELGCGTALPSLALFQWALQSKESKESPLFFTLADYNPTVLQLVTMPNFLLAWALQRRGHDQLIQDALAIEGELEINEHVIAAFRASLHSSQMALSFVSGGWSAEFAELVYNSATFSGGATGNSQTLIMGAETIYSPFALASFTDTLLSMLQKEKIHQPEGQAIAIIAAKRLYFGVGGSLDDFVEKISSLGATVSNMREETEGVRRGVVKCILS